MVPLLVIHVLVCILLIGVILLQTGRGAATGASFGGGTRTFFGSAGHITFLGKVIIVLATIFMATTIFMSVFYSGSEPPKIEPEAKTSAVYTERSGDCIS